MLVLAAVINGGVTAPLLVAVTFVSNSKRLVGAYVNGNAAKILGGSPPQ